MRKKEYWGWDGVDDVELPGIFVPILILYSRPHVSASHMLNLEETCLSYRIECPNLTYHYFRRFIFGQ